MFKGLRTKIESEQQSQGGKLLSQPSDQLNRPSHNDDNRESRSSEINSSSDDPKTTNQEHIAKDDIKILSNNKDYPQSIVVNSSNQVDERLLNTITNLKTEVSELNRQLESVIKEKDESNDQNAQLYQLIEKLRRNLELEKETNTSLQIKLEEADLTLREISQTKSAEAESASRESLHKKPTSSISIKTFDPTTSADQSPDDDTSLRQRLNELQNQLLEKNRQLKIRQQNLIDIKKALQKEMHEHIKTQEELVSVRNQLKQQAQNVENGFSQSDFETKQKGYSKEQEPTYPRMPNDASEEVRETTMLTPQLDMMSCLSRSSASVDDCDSNDVQHREVNLEYLRNVLYRYMTTTDTETAQHLVKALSVLMNFTQEQSAAIKSAMHSRSSWLRLK